MSGLFEYTDQLLGEEDAYLQAMRDDAARQGLPSIQVTPELARLLPLLVIASGARHILEIGTLFGYSGVILARALPPDGQLITLEVNERHAAVAEANFAGAGLAAEVIVLRGPAQESLAKLAGRSFDLVFIDADKSSYPVYLASALEMTHPGSVIVCDNLWRNGDVLRQDGDEAAVAIARFNPILAAEPRLMTTIIPTGDGHDAVGISVVRR